MLLLLFVIVIYVYIPLTGIDNTSAPAARKPVKNGKFHGRLAISTAFLN